MELVAIALVLELTYPFGRRLPARLLLTPINHAHVALGLLVVAALMVASRLVLARSALHAMAPAVAEAQ